MLKIAEILGCIIRDYQEKARENDMDSRLVVPGPTKEISIDIHEFLRQNDINSYLVVGQDLDPDGSKHWIHPVGLTSVRQGSFVAISCPGQLAHIQDSIKGSGGTIRSVSFSEEWPWIDNGNEAFRFDGPVLDMLISGWASREVEKEWLREFVLKYLIPSTRTFSKRAHLVLEEILGEFSPMLYPELDDVRLKMLFQSGLPRPTNSLVPVKRTIDKITKLCKVVVKRYCDEEDIRQQASDKIGQVIPEEERDDVRDSLYIFLDGIGKSETLNLGSLAFYSCWAGDTGHWLRLDTARIQSIFEVDGNVDPPESLAQIRIDEIQCERSHISEQRDVIATFHGKELLISGTYEILPNELSRYTWTIRLTYRNGEIETQNVNSINGTGTFRFPLDTAEVFNQYTSALLVRVVLLANEGERASDRVTIHLCGDSRPSFVVVIPGFEVVGTSRENNEEKIETDEAVHVYMFSNGEEPKFLDFDGIEQQIINTEHQGIYQSGNKVDPSGEASGLVTRICEFGEETVTLSFESRDIESGEFTLEDELRIQITSQRNRNINTVIGIFEGTIQEPYYHLGKINEASRRRILLAIDITKATGWQPLLLDLVGGEFGEYGSIGDYIACRGNIDEPAFNNLKLPSSAVELLREYSKLRLELIKVIQDSIQLSGQTLDHPVYASHPIYVNTVAEKMEELLISYLKSYHSILDYVERELNSLEWEQIFVLIYVDCVVNWNRNNSELRNSIFLVGPWHPLVLAKRYMVQAALFARAKRLSDGEDKSFRQLAVLLQGIDGFRWLPGLRRDDKSIEPLFVTPTSDPGWHLAVKQDIVSMPDSARGESVTNPIEVIRECLGLEAPQLGGSTGDLAFSALTNFMRAFPARRAVGIRIQQGYSIPEILASVNRFLHTKEKTLIVPTESGKQLPGGIHVFCEEPVKEDINDDITWFDPPILVYKYQEDLQFFKDTSPDIYLLSSAKETSFHQAPEKYYMPRGSSRQCVFSEPLYWLTSGQAMSPNSMSLEYDNQPQGEEGLSKSFVGATSKVCQILQERLVTIRSINLPQSLDFPWAVTPGINLDPAILVKYVRDGCGRAMEERALWDYKFDITEAKNTYYVLSTISRGFSIAVNGFFDQEGVAKKFIGELGAIGIAIGGEALKSGRHALGIIGLVGTIRLLKGTGGSDKSAFKDSQKLVGFLIPVDAFISFFGGDNRSGSGKDESAKRTDLLAIQLALPVNEEKLQIYACGVESKFVSRTFTRSKADEALEQAKSSINQFSSLITLSLKDGGMPERLGLLEILKFGLRISSPSNQAEITEWIKKERIVFQSILSGEYEYRESKHDAIVVSTEGSLPGVAETIPLPEGMWIRINKRNWPGISETPSLEDIREELSSLFDIPENVSQSSEAGQDLSISDIPASGTQHESTPSTDTGEHSTGPTIVTDGLPSGQVTGASGSENEASGNVNQSCNDETSPLQRILLGADEGRRQVFFDPHAPVERLDNLNLMITGSSGKGKTQLLKYLICAIREQGRNVLVLDFKNDIASDASFIQRAHLRANLVSFDGLPFNPLIPYPIADPRTGQLYVQCGQHITGIASVLKRAYSLGIQQEAAVKNAIRNAFRSNGVDPSTTVVFDESIIFPDFSQVGQILENDNIQAYNRLDPLFTLGIFRDNYRRQSVEELLGNPTVIDLSQIPSEPLRNTLAELVILSSHSYFNSRRHTGALRQVLVVDEAHRILKADYMERFSLECRAYGVGLFLSSQYPSHFPPAVSASLSTKIIHGNDRDYDRVRDIANLIGYNGHEAEIGGLGMFEAVISNRQYQNVLIKTMNYPLYLLHSFLLNREELTREEISDIEGIETSQTSVDSIIAQIEKLGLAEESDGRIRLLSHHG